MFVTSSGTWLSSPVGVLKASDSSGNPTSALLTLADPRYDAATHTLSFKVLFCLCPEQASPAVKCCAAKCSRCGVLRKKVCGSEALA